jgi:hypothetical protein
MLKIDNTLLEEVGLGGLPAAEKNSLLKHIYETLEMRVGIRLADQMTNQQLDEFEQYFEAKDDAGAFKWLETNFPNYKDIVQEEFNKLKAEVGQSAPQILAASQQQAAAQPAMQPPVQQPSPQQPPADYSAYQGAQPSQAPAQPYVAPDVPPVQQPPQPQPYQQPYVDPAQQQPYQQPPYPQQQPPAGPQQQ